jgi:DNA-binding LacI/PurR family transcriptional regulator
MRNVSRNVSYNVLSDEAMAATIKDIAKQLNISVSTVSYALNGGPRQVPDAVKDRVLSKAREIGYRPNRLARSMVTGKSMTIGIVPDRPEHDIMLGPYVQGMVNAVMNGAEDSGYDILFYTRADATRTRETASLLLDGSVDGLIFMSNPGYQDVFPELDRTGMPYVVVSMAFDNAPAFSVDNTAGIRLAVEHLAEKGHKKIGFLAGLPEHRDASERLEAFKDLCEEFSIETKASWIEEGQFLMQGGAAGAHKILSQEDRPSAIISANDEMAVGAMNTAQELGLKVPKDISIVGFDDADIAAVSHPPLTTIRQPINQIGGAATECLISRINAKETDPTQVKHVRFQPELVVRRSTSSPAEDINT